MPEKQLVSVQFSTKTEPTPIIFCNDDILITRLIS